MSQLCVFRINSDIFRRFCVKYQLHGILTDISTMAWNFGANYTSVGVISSLSQSKGKSLNKNTQNSRGYMPNTLEHRNKDGGRIFSNIWCYIRNIFGTTSSFRSSRHCAVLDTTSLSKFVHQHLNFWRFRQNNKHLVTINEAQ